MAEAEAKDITDQCRAISRPRPPGLKLCWLPCI